MQWDTIPADKVIKRFTLSQRVWRVSGGWLHVEAKAPCDQQHL